ncbi:unnamed protein product [Effrenium voratum]|nr:unnamed protein product [Effrenium voratum]
MALNFVSPTLAGAPTTVPAAALSSHARSASFATPEGHATSASASRAVPLALGAAAARLAAAQRKAATSRRSALKQRPVQVVEEVDGDVCSLWPGAKSDTRTIPQELMEESVGLDNVMTLGGDFVRACRKGAKQVATIGPASSSDEKLEELFLCGVDTFRLNFSHGEHEEKADLITRLRALEAKYRHPIGILADMQGPKQRCGQFKEGAIQLKLGQRFRFDMDPQLGDETRVTLPHPEILKALEPGKDQRLLLDDGKIRMKVVGRGYLLDGKEISEEEAQSSENATPFVDCEVTVPGKLGGRKGVNTPDVILPMSPITPKDREDIKFACRHGVDWIGMSFVQQSGDMEELREIVDKLGFREVKLLAKIEKPSAVTDLDNILKACDGVMVARGDLGVEMNPEEVPFVQKSIITQAHALGKPVIVATQMLESMISNPMPTRAECSDVANAILDGCDAVMLSGESAVGQYPCEAVTMQRRVIEQAQAQQSAQKLEVESDDATEAVLQSAAQLAKELGACGIVVFTATGRTAQLLSQRRPGVPIVAICKCLEVARHCSLMHGVYGTSDPEAQQLAALAEEEGSFHKVRFNVGVEIACRLIRDKGIARTADDWVVVVSRLPLFQQGKLNTIRLVPAKGPKAADGYGPEQD